MRPAEGVSWRRGHVEGVRRRGRTLRPHTAPPHGRAGGEEGGCGRGGGAVGRRQCPEELHPRGPPLPSRASSLKANNCQCNPYFHPNSHWRPRSVAPTLPGIFCFHWFAASPQLFPMSRLALWEPRPSPQRPAPSTSPCPRPPRRKRGLGFRRRGHRTPGVLAVLLPRAVPRGTHRGTSLPPWTERSSLCSLLSSNSPPNVPATSLQIPFPPNASSSPSQSQQRVFTEEH